MSTNDSKIPKDDRISLADEAALKQVLLNSVLGLWDVVNDAKVLPARWRSVNDQ